MAQTKALADVITQIHCSIVGEMSIKISILHLGWILVNSDVRPNCGKIRENTLAVIPTK